MRHETVKFIETSELLEETFRNSSGFGSTGKS